MWFTQKSHTIYIDQLHTNDELIHTDKQFNYNYEISNLEAIKKK